MYTNNEIMFPSSVIPLMRDMRGDKWRQLIDHILPLKEDHPEKLALILMMVRFNGCLECETDSYRAMRGCAMCTAQTLRRYKGSDEDLLKMYNEALIDMEEWLREEQEVAIRIA